jgi:hypothetical protein
MTGISNLVDFSPHFSRQFPAVRLDRAAQEPAEHGASAAGYFPDVGPLQQAVDKVVVNAAAQSTK